MRIKKIITGYLKENCYILINNNDCLIIDPGDNYDDILKVVKSLNIKGILITHYHFDHIGALNKLLNYKKTNVYDYRLSEKIYKVDDFEFKIIKTPGHTSDSISFYFESDEVMFTGDFIFKNSIGRTDLESGSDIDMKKSIEKFKNFNKNITIYPGHGDKSNIDYELKHNIYLSSLQNW